MIFAMLLSGCDGNEASPTPTPSAEPSPLLTAAQTPSASAEPEPLKYNEYIISLEYFPEMRTVSGVERVTYKNRTGSPIYRVFFNLYLNAFDEDPSVTPYFQSNYDAIFKYGKDYGKINVTSAFVDGAPASHLVSGTVLNVYLPFLLYPDEEVTIELSFEAYIPKIAHRTGADDNAAWFGNFLPILAVYDAEGWHTEPYYPAGKPFYSNISNYSVKITTPAEYTVVGAGDASYTETGGKKITAFNAKMLREFAFAVSNGYKEAAGFSETGVYIYFNHYSPMDAEKSGLIVDIAADCVDYMSSRIGGYPYKNLTIAENGNYAGTTTYPTLIFLNTETIQSSSLSLEFSIAGAIARQWFYNIVGNNQISEAWLGEGLSAFVSYEYVYDDEQLENAMRDLYLRLSENYANLPYTSMLDDLSVYSTSNEFYSIQYTKALLMFYALREKMGRDMFDEFLKVYYKNNYFMVASRKNLVTAAEEVYGESLTGFFANWIYGDELPVMFAELKESN